MPYIREYLKNNPSLEANPGELNYQIHQLITLYIENKGSDKYQTYNDIIGVLECIKLELYRRMVAPFEDIKKEQNGDVEPYSSHGFPSKDIQI